MSKTEDQYRDEIVRIGRLMFEKGWVASNDGNISVRLGPNLILATPASVSKGMLQPDDMLTCDLEGRKLSGHRQPTSEILMHLTIYKTRPDINAVVHAHPPVSTGFAVAGRPLNMGVLPEVIVALGAVPLAEYGLPGTPALSESMMPYMANYDALLLANHGVVAYADELLRAFFRMDTVEHSARICLVAELLGGPRLLSRNDIMKLFDSRDRYGVKSKNRYEPGWPLAAQDVPEPDEKITMSRKEILALMDEVLKSRGRG